MVRIQDLSLVFGEQVLFEHLDLTLLPNEWVSLLGCSGVGKSTLLRLIARLEIQGKIQGNIIFHPNIRVAWLPQKDTLYPWLSIIDNVQLENVLFGNKSTKTTLQAKALLEQVGLSEHLHKSCAQLSGGQKQRVAIARGLMMDANLILADEPTGALDSKTGHLVMDIFHRLHEEQDKTIVLITHSQELAHETERMITISDGRIIAELGGEME